MLLSLGNWPNILNIWCLHYITVVSKFFKSTCLLQPGPPQKILCQTFRLTHFVPSWLSQRILWSHIKLWLLKTGEWRRHLDFFCIFCHIIQRRQRAPIKFYKLRPNGPPFKTCRSHFMKSMVIFYPWDALLTPLMYQNDKLKQSIFISISLLGN